MHEIPPRLRTIFGHRVDIVCNRQDSGVALNSSVTALQASGAAMNLTGRPPIWRPSSISPVPWQWWLLLLR
jgi:hypothetical protein